MTVNWRNQAIALIENCRGSWCNGDVTTTIIPKGHNVNMATENSPYWEKFPIGSNVRVKDAAHLEEFKRTWRLHHPISSKQVACGAD